MGALRIVSLSLLIGLAWAVPAAAAPGFLGSGHDPGVAVDGTGTAHVAWLAEAGDAGTIEYCQVPRGKRACALRRSIAVPKDGFGKVQVLLPRPGTVQIVAPILRETLLASSFDGGGTFVVTEIGAGSAAIERALYGPGEFISLISGSGPAAFGRYNPDGSGPRGYAVDFASASESLETSIAPWGAGYAFFFSGLRARSVLWNGQGDPNAPESWVEGPALGRADEPDVVGGRSGTWVAYLRRGRDKTYVRRLRTSGRLGTERRLLRDTPLDITFAQGPRGHLALVYAMVHDSVWVLRSRNGRRWARPKRMFRGNDPEDLRSALGPRGGWLVWDGDPGNAGQNTIRIAAIPGPPRR